MQAAGTMIEEAPAQPAARISARTMFRYSQFLDVGDGAVECEHSRDGECSDIEHFHAWIRLPNPYQIEDIRRKGLAAKARRIRELHDPDSDTSVVLDQELAASDDPVFIGGLIDELVARDWAEDYLDAQRDVEEREEFEHITQDREEFARLAADEERLPEAEQSEEFKRLSKHVQSYIDALRDRLEEVQKPKRLALRERPPEAILKLARERRVEEDGDRAFLDAYNAWMWFVGTYKVGLHATLGRPHEPMWEDIGQRERPAAGAMFGEPPEVLDALRTAYGDLQVALQRASSGN